MARTTLTADRSAGEIGALAPATVWRWALALAVGAELALLAVIVLAAGPHNAWMVPASRHGFPDWMHGPLSGLGLDLTPGRLSALLAAMTFAYGVAIVAAGRSRARWPLAAAAGALALVALAPPLLSADAFAYIAWGRMGARGLDPYSHLALAVGATDPAAPFQLWHHGTTPYGPLFTLGGYALAPLSVAAALWSLKAIAGAAAIACAALLHRAASVLGRPPLRAVLVFALNPLVLVYAVGGAHNDLLVAAVLAAAALAFATGRSSRAAAAVVVAGAVKASAVVALPFAIAGAPRGSRRAALTAGIGAGAAIAALGLAAFGLPVASLAHVLGMQQSLVAHASFPAALARLLGLGAVTSAERLVLTAALAIVAVALLARVWSGRMEWVAATGWAFLALLVTTTWLLPWYVTWALPFVAVAVDRRLVAAAVALTLAIVVVRSPLAAAL
ncbi:MAG: glycosyltransferase 87 family protein [Solirubrobacteraceae bacterium]|nr:glycosyltransferase 87 family protein [Solirubrobacteraceae bacterium]